MNWKTTEGDDFMSYPFFTKNISRSDLNAILELAKLIGRINGIKQPENKEYGRNIDDNDNEDLEPFTPSKCNFETLPFTKEYTEDEEDEIEHNAHQKETNPEPYAEEHVKHEHPSVFICNRLTFLIKTKYPIIWDTSVVVESDEDCIFIALDKAKNPMVDMKEAAKLAMYINSNTEIQNEIKDFIEDTKWSAIVCSPYRMAYNGDSRFGFMFTMISE